ncbi:MAG: nucleotidyltransferase domain-containing protein, partial [Proteobacteria bacterium]|nr:nucleotidyltransferase domain-containing protein [Pseudomonadota bacterium]
QISIKELTIVTAILRKVDGTIFIFGSRARGTARLDSDLDICLKNDDKEIPLNVISQLREDFMNSDLPFQVDLVDYFHLSEDFRKNIAAELIKIDT